MIFVIYSSVGHPFLFPTCQSHVIREATLSSFHHFVACFGLADTMVMDYVSSHRVEKGDTNPVVLCMNPIFYHPLTTQDLIWHALNAAHKPQHYRAIKNASRFGGEGVSS